MTFVIHVITVPALFLLGVYIGWVLRTARK